MHGQLVKQTLSSMSFYLTHSQIHKAQASHASDCDFKFLFLFCMQYRGISPHLLVTPAHLMRPATSPHKQQSMQNYPLHWMCFKPIDCSCMQQFVRSGVCIKQVRVRNCIFKMGWINATVVQNIHVQVYVHCAVEQSNLLQGFIAVLLPIASLLQIKKS